MLQLAQSVDISPCRRPPEYGLLAGILERACRDLVGNVEQHERREAIQWFATHFEDRYTGNEGNYIFSARQVISALGLNGDQVALLRRWTYEAMERGQE